MWHVFSTGQNLDYKNPDAKTLTGQNLKWERSRIEKPKSKISTCARVFPDFWHSSLPSPPAVAAVAVGIFAMRDFECDSDILTSLKKFPIYVDSWNYSIKYHCNRVYTNFYLSRYFYFYHYYYWTP